jgi:hypothetical protein
MWHVSTASLKEMQVKNRFILGQTLRGCVASTRPTD